MAKNVANPALISVKNLEPFLSCLCPENSNLNRRPTTLLATAMFVFSTWEPHQHNQRLNGLQTHTQPMTAYYVSEIMYQV
jgi:hypothetical protein